MVAPDAFQKIGVLVMGFGTRVLFRRSASVLRMSGCLLPLALLFSPASAADFKLATAEESRLEFDRTVKPFLAKHCVECHGTKNPEGDLDLITLDPDMKASPSAARWSMLVERLNTGDMPPPDKPRPDAAAVAATIRWATAESKRANRNFARRNAAENGNLVPHAVLFDPQNIPPFDGPPRVRPVSAEIYGAFLKSKDGKLDNGSQPFSPMGGTTFKDMGDTKIDEPITVTLFQNALRIVEKQTAHTVADGKIAKWTGRGELRPLFDPDVQPTDSQLKAAIVSQFQKYLRRPPTDHESEKLLSLLRKNMLEAGRVAGVRYTLAAIMMLPEAWFRSEVGRGTPDEKGRLRLSPREIAFAIAYGLTDTGPDDALLKTAAGGGLGTDDAVGREVRRMLDDSKLAKPRILRFFREYFAYENAPEVFKEMDNGGGAIEFNGHAPVALVADTDRLVEYILEQDRDVLRELLTTNKSFVNYKKAAEAKAQLAKAREHHENNPKKKGQPFIAGNMLSMYEAYGLSDYPLEQPVELPKDQRAGILTQPAWLVAHSTTYDNHAIHRGKWIRERLLGNVVPDVPITVDAQLPDTPEKTLRERMAVTEQAYCWKCHQLMNDLAYPLDQFDHFGRYRTMDAVVDLEATAQRLKQRSNARRASRVMTDVPLNSSGLVAHVGDPSVEGPVEGAVQLMHKLANSERVEQVFVRHVFRYWLGRNESPGDAASLQAAHRAYKESGGSMRALITAILSSESFLYRVPDNLEQDAEKSADRHSEQSGQSRS